MGLKLGIRQRVTLLGQAILSLVICLASASALAQAKSTQYNKPSKKLVLSADQVLHIEEPKLVEPHILFAIARSTNLNDFKDGSRSDGMDFLLAPSLRTSFGVFSTKISYSQNIRDDNQSASDWNDAPVTYIYPPIKWEWAQPYILTLTPTVTALIPLSQATIKKDQLQTSISTGVSFGIIPDGIAPRLDGAWNLAVGLTAGRNFHTYEENINGSVLNQYSSNQTLNLGYTYKKFSFGIEYIHKSRWTYQGRLKDSFDLSQELGYTINDNISVALGHSNGGSSLRPNGYESNFSLINENSSMVYGQMAVSF